MNKIILALAVIAAAILTYGPWAKGSNWTHDQFEIAIIALIVGVVTTGSLMSVVRAHINDKKMVPAKIKK